MTTPNYRKASIYFDDETVLEVEQRGGGGSGVGGDTGLSAVNLITGESTNDALAEKDETIEEQAGTIEQQEATIETQAATISDLEDEVAAKQAIIDAFPTIEALNVTANGTYNEDGKAYKPVTVNVPASGYVANPDYRITWRQYNKTNSPAVSITYFIFAAGTLAGDGLPQLLNDYVFANNDGSSLKSIASPIWKGDVANNKILCYVVCPVNMGIVVEAVVNKGVSVAPYAAPNGYECYSVKVSDIDVYKTSVGELFAVRAPLPV